MSKILSKSEMIEVIAHHEVFAGFNQAEKEQLASILSFRSAQRNETIFEIGDKPDHIFFLLEGLLILNFPERTKLNLLPNELIGEIGILNDDFRLGKLVALEDSQMIAICTRNLFDSRQVSPKITLEIIRRLSKRVTNYLRSIQQTSTKEIIESGENEHIEFKSTLRWNLKANKKDPKITHAILKTIAAFLNTDGGTLIVGVSDNGEVLGLDQDNFENEDKLLLFLTNIINDRIGTLYLENIHYQLEHIDNKDILRVDITPANTPCFISVEKFDHLYIRTGPSTTDLRLSEVFDYIKRRFDD